jgi:hypothetical protein
MTRNLRQARIRMRRISQPQSQAEARGTGNGSQHTTGSSLAISSDLEALTLFLSLAKVLTIHHSQQSSCLFSPLTARASTFFLLLPCAPNRITMSSAATSVFPPVRPVGATGVDHIPNRLQLPDSLSPAVSPPAVGFGGRRVRVPPAPSLAHWCTYPHTAYEFPRLFCVAAWRRISQRF